MYRPIEWSQELASYAQKWADHLAKTGCQFQHRPNAGVWKQIYGENIFWGGGSGYGTIDAAKMWYAEKKKYAGGKLTAANWYKSGHYTQMVWRKTTQMGCGVARCPNGAVIVVGNYNPAGNYRSEKPY